MQFHEPNAIQKTVRTTVLLTILAWMTHLLMAQLGWGQTLVASSKDWPAWPPEVTAGEQFVPGTPRFAAGATLELRDEATIVGAEVRLKQIARWSDDDAGAFKPVADLVLLRLSESTPYKKISVTDVRTVLRDAGVNLAGINFRGATQCTVSRSDVRLSEKALLDAWVNQNAAPAQTTIDSALVTSPEPAIAPTPNVPTLTVSALSSGVPSADVFASIPSTPVDPGAAVVNASLVAPLPGAVERTEARRPAPAVQLPEVRSLRDILLADLSDRLGIASDALQVSFAPESEKIVNLLQPTFGFQVESSRSRALGSVGWSVTITPPTGPSKRMLVKAVARAWQDQLLVARPVAAGQVIRADDVVSKRTLIDVLDTNLMLTPEQAIGQQAARELKPGIVVTSRLLDPVPLVRTGQFVTISISRGAVSLQTVGRALENGTFGQTIRVKNEVTRDLFEVVVTGPQTGRIGAVQNNPTTLDATVRAD